MVQTTDVRTKIIDMAKSYLGRPYKLGAKTGNIRLFDCSSLVQYVYGRNGISLPRISRQQVRKGIRIPFGAMKPGDLLFYWSNRTRPGVVGHVAIYLGRRKILHAVPDEGVIISALKRKDEHFQIFYMKSKRVIS